MWRRSLQLLSLAALGACAADDRAPSVETARTVALATGDRVTLPADRGAPLIQPGPGRERVGFVTVRQGARLFVIPDDVAPQLASGLLALADFDVTLQAGVLGPKPEVRVAAGAPTYALTLHGRDRDGAPDDKVVILVDRATQEGWVVSFEGEATIALAAGEYILLAASSNTSLGYPRLSLHEDATIELDDRIAAPIAPTVAGVDLVVERSDVGMWALPEGSALGHYTVGPAYAAQLGPEAPADEFHSTVVAFATPRGSDTEVYDLAHGEAGHVMNGWHDAVPRRELSKVEVSHAGEPGSIYRRWLAPASDDFTGGFAWSYQMHRDYGPRGHRTEYLYGQDVIWASELDRLVEISRHEIAIAQPRTERVYLPGHHYVERWNRAPFGPTFAERFSATTAARLGDMLSLSPSMFSDVDPLSPPRASQSSTVANSAALYRDDVLVAENTSIGEPWIFAAVGPAPATYRFESRANRDMTTEDGVALFPLSTEVDATWVFPSAAGDAFRLVLPTVRFEPVLDDDNRAGRVLVLPVKVEYPPDTTPSAITNIAVEISYDDGRSWAKLPGIKLGDRWLGVIVHPPGAQFASLRGSARDADGRTNEVTIVRAYRL